MLVQKNDKYHVFSHILFLSLLPNRFVLTVVKITILIELRGIKIAATTGDNCPVTAKYNPNILYINDNTKLNLMMLIASLETIRKSHNWLNLVESKMASHAGENTLMFSEIATPMLL